MAERDSVRVGGSTIEYEVRRSTRRKKTVQITLDGGAVQVYSPSATPAGDLRDIVRKRASWILSRVEESARAPAPKRFVSGETLPYLGRNLRVVVKRADVLSPEVRFDHWRLCISAPKGIPRGARSERLRAAVVEWYRTRAAERLCASVEQWRRLLGVSVMPLILIGYQRRRWGSCGTDGTLRFSWRLMMLEPALIEYVAVHELAHLTFMNHSKAFWDLVSEVMPDMLQRRHRLREVERTLPL